MDIKSKIEELNDEYLKFDLVENKLSNRPDLNAFILLDKLLPGKQDIISASEHDVFYLSIDIEDLSKVATEEDIKTLVRCGVMYESEYDCLSMFS